MYRLMKAGWFAWSMSVDVTGTFAAKETGRKVVTRSLHEIY